MMKKTMRRVMKYRITGRYHDTSYQVGCCRSLTSSPLCGLAGVECVPSLGPRDTTRRSWMAMSGPWEVEAGEQKTMKHENIQNLFLKL